MGIVDALFRYYFCIEEFELQQTLFLGRTNLCVKKPFPDGKGFFIYLYISLLENLLRVFLLLEGEFSVSHR